MYSKKSIDNCGICDGKNDTCEGKAESLEINANFGYNYFTTIPAKATNIFVSRSKEKEDLGCLGIHLYTYENIFLLFEFIF